MKLFNKKHYCLSACLLIACNHATTPHANQNVLEALELADLLSKKQQAQKTFPPKTETTFESAHKKLEDAFFAGEKMIQDAEKKAREEFDKLFNESKPKQNPKATTPSTPESAKSSSFITALKEKYLTIKEELSEQAEITKKLNLEKIRTSLNKANLDDEELDIALKQIKANQEKTKAHIDSLKKNLDNVIEALKANNIISVDLLSIEKNIQEYQTLLKEKKEALENGNLESFTQNARLNQLEETLKNRFAILLHKKDFNNFEKEILENLRMLFPQFSLPKETPKQPAKAKSSQNLDSDSDDEDSAPTPKAKMPKAKPMPKIQKEEDDW